MGSKIMRVAVVVLTLAVAQNVLSENLIRYGTFDGDSASVLQEFRCSNSGTISGTFDIFTEDLSWNKCGRLTASAVHDEMAGGKMRKVSSAYLRFGGTNSNGIAVQPNMFYEYAFELKGSPKSVIFRIYETSEVDGKEVKKSVFNDMHYAPGKDWRRYIGRYRAGPKAKRIELCLLLWTLIGEDSDGFQPGDCVLVDNVSFVRSDRFARLLEAIAESKESLRIAPYPVEADPSCPFLPFELADPPEKIVFRAAVNEKKPLPIAIGNMTASFAQYRVILETDPRRIAGTSVFSDNGDFGLEGFPQEKITVREALRFKDTEEAPVSTRLDPLVGVNEASVISVPPKEAGAVWFDFDTYDVQPATYRGRLRVIPLNEGSVYKRKDGRYIRERTNEKIIPVEFTVDPIILPREAVRPAHLCSPCESEQSFQLESDIGARLYAIPTGLFRPEAVGNPESPARRMIARYRQWVADRGVTITFFVKYDALNVSQTIFNPKRDPDKKWAAWEQYVRTLAQVMEEAGVQFENYYVLIRDEPYNKELETVREAHQRLKRLYPQMRTYISACERIEGKIDYLDYLGETTDLWSLTSRMYGSEQTVAKLHALKAKYGTKLLHYLCNTSVKEPLSGYFRRHCWRGEHWGLDADMLYHFNIWNFGHYGELSFKVVPQGEISYKAGNRFVPSVRYMAYREGVTDIKYVQALREKRGGEPAVQEFLRDAVRDVVVGDTSSMELPRRMREKIRTMLLGDCDN
jgi:hypothetical protein